MVCFGDVACCIVLQLYEQGGDDIPPDIAVVISALLLLTMVDVQRGNLGVPNVSSKKLQ